jgi:cytochrome c peroxidase
MTGRFHTGSWSAVAVAVLAGRAGAQHLGEERAIHHHLADGAEFSLSLKDLIAHGGDHFAANWTVQEGGGRPGTKGVGSPLSDPSSPLVFPRAFNRLSAPDANSCAGCHNAPFGISGGGGDFVTNVFVLAHRFDFATFDHNDLTPTKGAIDESGKFPTIQEMANSRATLGMFGSGFIEMLARQMTAQLQAIRDSIPVNGSAALVADGISFGTLARDHDGIWITSGVVGLPAPSLSFSRTSPPSLIIRPFHQAGAVISLRQFTNNAMNHHHGIQTVERFGAGTDPDQDAFLDEMSIADTTATSLFQATMAIPGRVIPNDAEVEAAVMEGEDLFVEIGCAECHVPCMNLKDQNWIFSEPNPYNPPGNLRRSDGYVATYGVLSVDLTHKDLPQPRPKVGKNNSVHVAAFTDLKLHDITSGATDPNREPIDMQEPAGSPGFFAGNSKFLTKKLWGAANEPPYFHHGQFTTMRQAIEAHAGEASAQKAAWDGLHDHEKDAVIEFLKTLRVLPAGTKYQVVDENGKQKRWRDFPYDCSGH